MRSSTNVAVARNRRGSALVLVLVLTTALAAIVLSGIYLSSASGLLGRYFDREQEFRYAAEAALAVGKSRLNNDPYALPDTGDTTLLANATITGADGNPLPGVLVNLYAGQTGSTSGQFGRFASVVAEARDASGSRFVRRLELAQESFAKFAYWSNRESNGGSTIWFAGGDNLWGPVWSNDDLHIHSSGATFHNDVGTAGTIVNPSYGTFVKGYAENQKPITLPNNTTLSNLPGYAGSGNFSFVAPTSGGPTSVRMRIEFVPLDLNADTDSSDVNEGFFRVYTANGGREAWLRGDFIGSNCGDWHQVLVGGAPQWRFYPAAVHTQMWARNQWVFAGGPLTGAQADAERGEGFNDIMKGMQGPGAKCFPGGDPHLAAVERNGAAGYTSATWEIGGSDTTFTPAGVNGSWRLWPGAVDPLVTARVGGTVAPYLYPMYRGQNPGTKGVIYVDGTVALSGVLRGRVTLYASANVIFVDDLRYATDPASGRCGDILGIIATTDAVVADNGLNSPQQTTGGGGGWRSYDLMNSGDFHLHSVVMTLNTSFRAENHSSGPTSARPCGGVNWGRGCLFLSGGLIQEARGPVGTTGGTGFIKRYSYDRCALVNPPPYFPTTGRFLDNRYYEIDPVRFDVTQLFASLTPQP